MKATRMSAFSTEELRGQIAAGQYTVDADTLAEAILSKFATIRRVRRTLTEEEGSAGEAGRAAQPRARRGSRPASLRPRQSRSERLP
jgi:Anti-sigma-28 factor, FlgM